jgi:hypothetical protein
MDISKYLESLSNELLEENNWQKVIMTREWTSQIPSTAGVYILKENQKIVYVGETGNLRGRMNDLLDTRHHSVRRTIGQKLFSTIEGYGKATTKVKFPSHIEELLNKHICANLSLAYVRVELGRKELEELIVSSINKDIRLNKRGKRK